MEDKKTKMKDFIKYLVDNDAPSIRLLQNLKDYFNENAFIEDITDNSFLMARYNIGKKSLTEFNELRKRYLQHISSVVYEESPREEFHCWLRSDISKTLKVFEDKTSFVEKALLEKFEREGVKLAIINRENETT